MIEKGTLHLVAFQDLSKIKKLKVKLKKKDKNIILKLKNALVI